jgi:hypothetical protein
VLDMHDVDRCGPPTTEKSSYMAYIKIAFPFQATQFHSFRVV